MPVLDAPSVDEINDVSEWGESAPPDFEEQELGHLAFEFWQRACYPEPEADEDWLEEALRCHVSCL